VNRARKLSKRGRLQREDCYRKRSALSTPRADQGGLAKVRKIREKKGSIGGLRGTKGGGGGGGGERENLSPNIV